MISNFHDKFYFLLKIIYLYFVSFFIEQSSLKFDESEISVNLSYDVRFEGLKV